MNTGEWFLSFALGVGALAGCVLSINDNRAVSALCLVSGVNLIAICQREARS